MAGKAQRFNFLIDNLSQARGKIDSLSYRGNSPDGFAAEL